jgi:hypothetical protein
LRLRALPEGRRPRSSILHTAAPRRYHRTAENQVPDEPAFVPYSTMRSRSSRRSRRSRSGRKISNSSTGVIPVFTDIARIRLARAACISCGASPISDTVAPRSIHPRPRASRMANFASPARFLAISPKAPNRKYPCRPARSSLRQPMRVRFPVTSPNRTPRRVNRSNTGTTPGQCLSLSSGHTRR